MHSPPAATSHRCALVSAISAQHRLGFDSILLLQRRPHEAGNEPLDLPHVAASDPPTSWPQPYRMLPPSSGARLPIIFLQCAYYRKLLAVLSAPAVRRRAFPVGYNARGVTWVQLRINTMLPYDTIRVIDLSRALAGPYCTMMLGDLGADVIKVEVPGMGDDSRHWGPPFEGGESSYFIGCNRNKRSVTLNLKSSDGLALLWRLIERADVLVENFSPGKLDQLGVSYEAASARNPRLIYCGISGFGRDGPDANKPAYDIIVQGMSGLMSVTGEPDGDPMRTGPAISDVLAGMFAAWGIAGALYARERTGRGQRVDATLLGADLAAMANIVSRYFATNEPPRRVGNSHAQIAPYDTIHARDGYVLVAPANDELWQRFCAALDLNPLLVDARFATNRLRVEHRPALLEAINARTHELTREDILTRLEAARVPCGPIRDVHEAYSSPQARHLRLASTIAHPTAGQVRTTAIPVTLSATPGTIRLPPPLLGQHTAEILGEIGCTPQEIARWRADGVI